MGDCDLYARLFNLHEPWIVIDVDLNPRSKSVKVILGQREGAPLHFSECGAAGPMRCVKEVRRPFRVVFLSPVGDGERESSNAKHPPR